LPWPEPRITPPRNFGQSRIQTPRVQQNVAYLVEKLINDARGPVLCVCSTKAGTRGLADWIAGRLSVPNQVSESLSRLSGLIRAKYPYLSALAAYLEKGIAYHNASLPHEVKAAIEAAALDGQIRAIAATTTLAEGIDLPFYSTVLVDWLVWDGPEERPINPLLFRNIAGRSGRAGFHTEGEVYVFDNPNGALAFTGVQIRRNLQRSIMFTDESPPLESVAEREDFRTHPELQAVASAQFVASIPENPESEDLVPDFLRHTYSFARSAGQAALMETLNTARVSVLDEERGAIARAASPLRLTPLGVAANSTGLSPESVRTLIQTLEGLPEDSRANGELAARMVEGLIYLPELANDRLKKSIVASGRFLVKSNDIAGIVDDWIAGSDIQDIFLELPYVRRSGRKDSVASWATGDSPRSSWHDEFDKFADFMDGTVGSFLSWIARASNQLAPLVAGPSDLNWVLFADLLESGVNSAWGVAAVRAGASTPRKLLCALGPQMTQEFTIPGDPLGFSLMRLLGHDSIEIRVRLIAESAEFLDSAAQVSDLIEWLRAEAHIVM